MKKPLREIMHLDYVLVALVVVLIAVVAYQTVSLNAIQTRLVTATGQLVNNSNYQAGMIAATEQLLNNTNKISLQIAALHGSAGNTTVLGGFGSTIANIDVPLNSSELSVINDAPKGYFEAAGEMFLNNSLSDLVSAPVNNSLKVSPYMADGKQSVIYLGATSCIYCGENRWAMALALAQFGNFSNLYKGYSSFGDGDLPTLYWSVYNYTTSSGVAYGNGYSSKYVNFISADYESPIKQGFQLKPLSYFVQLAPNSTYSSALAFMNSTGKFQGTPFTLWGNRLIPGADGVVFGNTMPTNNTLPMTYMTHSDVLGLLKNFNSQFAYGEYAAADLYIALTCASLNNTASVCALPAIQQIQKSEKV